MVVQSRGTQDNPVLVAQSLCYEALRPKAKEQLEEKAEEAETLVVSKGRSTMQCCVLLCKVGQW